MPEIRESNWSDCLLYNSARKTTPDKSRARFLIHTSAERIEYLKDLKITEKGANFLFEGYYTSTIEILEAITLSEGFNIRNHLCLGYYLRDILKKENLFQIFERCRFKRNGIVYYGKLMKFEIAKHSVEEIKNLISELKLLIENNL